MGPCNTWKNGMDIERTDTFESQKDYKGTYGLIYDHTLFGFTLLWLNTTNSFFFFGGGWGGTTAADMCILLPLLLLLVTALFKEASLLQH